MQQHTEELGTKTITLNDSTRAWLRSPEGLVTLASAWRTGLYILRTQGVFVNTLQHYKDLKEGGFCIGLDLLEKGDAMQRRERYMSEPPAPMSPDEEYQHAEEQRREEERLQSMNVAERKDFLARKEHERSEISPDFVIRFYLAFSFEQYAKDHFEALPYNAKRLLLESMWDVVSKYEAIRNDKEINYYSSRRTSSGESISDSRTCFIWEDAHYEYDPVYLPEGEMQVHPWAILGYEFTILDGYRAVADVTGSNFSEIRRVINTYRPSIDSSEVEQNPKAKNRLFTGAHTKLWEEKLTTYLLSQGFLVSLEPDLYIPEQSLEPRRTPDLMVIHKGRVIMIEIDSRYHLTVRDDRTKRLEANVEKYKRDRAFDRYMLCNGIPVLRVWYDEVDKNPEQVMTQLLQIYDSIGGDRFRYR